MGIPNLIARARAFATAKHAPQSRKHDPKVPYVTHPIAVADMLAKIRTDPELIAAALLHDVVEDTGTPIEEIETQFGKRVAGLVGELTLDKTLKELAGKAKREAKTKYLIHKIPQMTPDARLIKLLDRLHNVSELEKVEAIKDKETGEPFTLVYAQETEDILDHVDVDWFPEEAAIITRIRAIIRPFLPGP